MIPVWANAPAKLNPPPKSKRIPQGNFSVAFQSNTNSPFLKLIGKCSNPIEALQLLQDQSVDLIFLDIQMKDQTGFDLLDAFREPSFKTIFTTAYDQFALKAFKYNGVDYLLKPIDPKELIKAIEKVKNVDEVDKIDQAFKEIDSYLEEGSKLSTTFNILSILVSYFS